MDIRINQTYGQIAIRSYPAKMTIEQPKNTVSIEQPPAELTIENKQAKVQIDQTQCFAESGLKPILQLASDFYRESIKVGIEAIGLITEDNNRLMEIEYGGNAILELAANIYNKEYELNTVLMPQSRPDISFDGGYVDISWKPNPPRIEWNYNYKPTIDVEKHNVDISMSRYPDIKIEYVGKTIDRQI